MAMEILTLLKMKLFGKINVIIKLFTMYFTSVLLASVVSFTTHAGIIAVNEFNGNLFEGFEGKDDYGIETNFSGFNGEAYFGGEDGVYGLVEHWTGGALQEQINPYEGAGLGSWIAGKESMEISFKSQILAFGGYFNSSNITLESIITFFNNDIVIAFDNLTVGFGTYNWQGWSVNENTSFNRILITHKAQSIPSSFLIFDNLQAIKMVPEYPALVIFLSGLFALVSRRFKIKS